MPRLLSTSLVIVLLVGTAAAFAVTERLKLVPTPIVAPRVTQAFSPVCGCPTASATIEFTLREADRLTVTIVDASDAPVETIASGERHRAGPARFLWRGRGAPEGVYRARVHLAEAHRTIRIPNTIRLDATPPQLTIGSVEPLVFSPDGDGRADRVRVVYAVSERAGVVLRVGGVRAVESPPRTEGALDWYGRDLRSGRYELTLVARDAAGNLSEPSATAVVRLRFVELAPRRITVAAGVRFGVRVSTDAERYRWQLGTRSGAAGGDALRLQAPLVPGRYTLRVEYGDHRDAIPVFVRARP